MKTTLKLEELAQFILCFFAFSQLSFSWCWHLALILLPAVSTVGYLINTRVGAVLYNIAHHKAIAIIIYVFGVYLANQNLQLTAIIMFGNSIMDRIMGFGLKYSDIFQNTQLGVIGNKH
jgi:hypothetical protein